MRCRACGTDSPPAARFCSECGAVLPPALAGPGAPAADASTPGLAARLVTSRASMEGERKQVSVLFADLKGSLELLADRDPEDARVLLDAVLERMIEAVHRYEGTVNQVMGDGIMALFGAPVAHEDHAVRACYAAVWMQRSLERYAEELRHRQGLDVQVRVGINSGEVVVRAISTELHVDYTAVGQTTHLAARLEQLARPGTILVSEETARLVRGYVELRRLGTAPVRGLAQPVALYEVTGLGPARSRLEAAAARGLSPFVGRAGEHASLRRALAETASGAGRVIGVTGEAGVGKSRLLWEVVHSPATVGWLVLEGRAVPYGRATPFVSVATALRAYFALDETDDARRIREKVSGRVLGLDESFAPLLSPLLTLLGVPVEDTRWQGLDPREQRRRVLDAVQRLVLRESRVQPVCVVIDDLQWTDPETEAVLERLAAMSGGARLLVVLGYRTDYAPAIEHETLRLAPLASEPVVELLGALLGEDVSLAAIKAELADRTGGNPFFLEESVWHLFASGALAGERGAARLKPGVSPPPIPATVQAALAARIDRLALSDKDVLQAASVIGRDVPLGLLAAVADLPQEAAAEALQRLRGAGFLHPSPGAPDVYVFRHALTLEVAYGTLVRERRRALDLRLVDAIDRRPDRSPGDVERLAHHALRAEAWERAVRYCREAGAAAFVAAAHRAAAAHFERALEALGHLAESAETGALAIDIRLDLRSALSPLGEFGRMLHVLQEAERLAHTAGDRARLGRVCSFLANLHTVLADFDRAAEYGARALEIADALDDQPLAIVTHALLVLAHHGQGRYRDAIAAARRSLALLADYPASERFGMFGMALPPAVYSRAGAAWAMAELGDFDEGAALGREGLRLAEAIEHPYAIVFASVGLGTLHLRQGDLDEAIHVLERARALAQRFHAAAASVPAAAPLASAYARSGRTNEALAVVEEAVEQAVALGDPYGHWLRTAGFAEVYLHTGRVEDALPLARRAVDLTRFVRARGSQAWASWLLGEVAASIDPEEADVAYRDALRQAREAGMRPLEAHCRLGLGRLLQARGQAEAARAEIEAAREAFTALAMPWAAARAGDALAS